MASPRRSARRRVVLERFQSTAAALPGLAEALKSRLQAHPRWSLGGFSLIALALALGLVQGEAPDGVETVHANVILPERDANAGRQIEAALDNLTTNPVVSPAVVDAPEPQAVIPEREWTLVDVRPGQTLERIFRDLSLGPRLLHDIVHLSEDTRNLARIRPGDQFAFDLTDDNEFVALRAELDEERWLFVEREEDTLVSRIEPRSLDRRVVEASGTISSSLFNAAKASGLSDNMTLRLANIFGWDVDFALDIRAGDQFAVVYEQVWRDGEFLRDGDILAARFVNQGNAFEAIRFDAGNGPDYFAPEGRPMRKAFLRAPLNFTRVTSNFNPRRFHPVTRRVRPHNGTDYGAATGTPIWAAGDGRVIESAYNNINGHYVFIQHGNNIVTRYLHLSRRQVARGDRVRQGQTIGRVGATGLATGPHLHYEFLLNGVHRNPRTIDLPPADPLPPELMDQFSAHGQGLLAQLQALEQSGILLARRDDEGCQASTC